MIAAVSAVLLLGVYAGVLVALCYRDRLKFLLFRCCGVRFPDNVHPVSDPGDYDFDAYVIYRCRYVINTSLKVMLYRYVIYK